MPADRSKPPASAWLYEHLQAFYKTPIDNLWRREQTIRPCTSIAGNRR
jgi:hypothetical protein